MSGFYFSCSHTMYIPIYLVYDIRNFNTFEFKSQIPNCVYILIRYLVIIVTPPVSAHLLLLSSDCVKLYDAVTYIMRAVSTLHACSSCVLDF